MLSLILLLKTKISFTNILSKTQRKRQQEDALSKNNGHDVRFRKRLLEEQEAYEELKRSLEELNNARETNPTSDN